LGGQHYSLGGGGEGFDRVDHSSQVGHGEINPPAEPGSDGRDIKRQYTYKHQDRKHQETPGEDLFCMFFKHRRNSTISS
jgi:hypothetical protein